MGRVRQEVLLKVEQPWKVDHDQTDLENSQLARDRPRRQVIAPRRLIDYECDYIGYEEEFEVMMCMMFEDGGTEPNSYQEALSDPDSDKWIEAVEDEMISLKKNRSWVLVDIPKVQKAIRM